ncbi:MAG: DUF192 domain-containing protein [Deltaproteobacteria bacterium]|nr:DUF192 domain-containing protein [Deltaproteobacteria bacterium]
MRIINTTRDRVLADRAQEARTVGARMKGLLGRDGLEPGQALLIRPCSSIHSFFMRFVFDAAFADARGEVLHVIHCMRPWRISRIVPRAQVVIELPAGVLEQTGTRVGDRIRFERQVP